MKSQHAALLLAAAAFGSLVNAQVVNNKTVVIGNLRKRTIDPPVDSSGKAGVFPIEWPTPVMEEKEEEEEEPIPTFAQELAVRQGEGQALVLHDLLVKAARAKKGLSEALNATGVNREEMESILGDRNDVTDNVMAAFEDLDQENARIGQEIVRFMQERVVKGPDGAWHYQASEPDPLEEHKDHRRRLDSARQDRWDKYHEQRRLLPHKLKHHRDLLKRHLADAASDCPEGEEALCFSEDMESFDTDVDEIVGAMQDELGPLITMMDLLSGTVGKVKKAAGTVGTLVTIFNVLKKMPGMFGTVFGAAYSLFNILDNGADPVEDALDDFEDRVLKIWEKTAGKALDMMKEFEDGFGTAVALFSFAAYAPQVPVLNTLVKGFFKVDLNDFNKVVMSVDKHIRALLKLLQSLMKAFKSKVFASFRKAADTFTDAIGEIDLFMKAFDFVEKAYYHKITLPFGMPRTLKSKKYGKASCSPHEKKHKRANRYPGYRTYQLVAPWNVACKENCPSGFDSLVGGKKCRKSCEANGLLPHKILGAQDGCLRTTKDKERKSLSALKKCSKIGKSWYRNIPTDKCRQSCETIYGKGKFFADNYKSCSFSCPKGMKSHPVFRDKACAIPDSQKFDRAILDASCESYTNKGTRPVYLKDTGGCYEDCNKSTEHSFRAVFMCVDKEKLKISVKDVVDFISNVIKKIKSIPGVGDILEWIDKALEGLFGFLEELIPKQLGFPKFDMGIKADFLDFGSITSSFDNIKLPDIGIDDTLGKTLDSIVAKVPDTPLNDIAKCALNIDCVMGALGLSSMKDRVDGAIGSVEHVLKEIKSTFENAPEDLITCAKESKKSIPCSDVLSMFNLPEDKECTIDLPFCDELNTTGMESLMGGVMDLFEGDANPDARHRKLSFTTWFEENWNDNWPRGSFLEILPLFIEPYLIFPSLGRKTFRLRSSFAGDIWLPKQQIGFHPIFRFPQTLSFGLYKSDCGTIKFAFEWATNLQIMFGFTHGFASMLEKSISISETCLGQKSGQGEYCPRTKNSECFVGGTCVPDALGNDLTLWKTPICKSACEADEMLGKGCNKDAMNILLNDAKQTNSIGRTTMTDNEKYTASRCIESWFKIRRDVQRKTENTIHKSSGYMKWIGRTLYQMPLSLDFTVPWHREDQTHEFYLMPQVGVGLVAYDTATRTEFGPHVWFCPTCNQPGKPIRTTIGTVAPIQFSRLKKYGTTDLGLYLSVKARYSIGVFSLGKDETGNGKVRFMAEEGHMNPNKKCCGDEGCHDVSRPYCGSESDCTGNPDCDNHRCSANPFGG